MSGAEGGMTWTVYDANKMTQREIYGLVLTELGEQHPEIVGLSADLAKSTKIGDFGDRFPERFFNVGIAEQNLFGMAAGMAKAGLLPFVSTFSVFATLRAGEFLRTDLCYQNLNVKVIATHGGTSFGSAGTTHHSIEDLALLRAIPNLTLIVPADGFETAKALRACMEIKGPVYIRIGRGFEPPVYESENYDFAIGKAIELRPGTDVTVIACGATVYHAIEASQMLEREGISVRVIDMHTLKPLDADAILRAISETRRIITVEDHNQIGGLGGAVADVIASSGKGCAFDKLGIPDTFCSHGYPEDLMHVYGIDTDGIAGKIREVLGRDFEENEDWEDEV